MEQLIILFGISIESYSNSWFWVNILLKQTTRFENNSVSDLLVIINLYKENVFIIYTSQRNGYLVALNWRSFLCFFCDKCNIMQAISWVSAPAEEPSISQHENRRNRAGCMTQWANFLFQRKNWMHFCTVFNIL